MASDLKLLPGDVVIAEDDFGLILVVSDDGWPEEWLWMGSGYRGTFREVPTRHMLGALLEGRALLRSDGQVFLCRCGANGWNERALEWWRGTR